MSRPVTITQQDDAGSYCAYRVQYWRKGGLHRGLVEARAEALVLARRYHTTVSETLKDWRSI
jgi:hypothetical protein